MAMQAYWHLRRKQRSISQLSGAAQRRVEVRGEEISVINPSSTALFAPLIFFYSCSLFLFLFHFPSLLSFPPSLLLPPPGHVLPVEVSDGVDRLGGSDQRGHCYRADGDDAVQLATRTRVLVLQ